MAFFASAIDTLKILVIALGAGLGAWGVVNLLEVTEMITQVQNPRGSSSSWLIKGNKKKGKAQSRRYQRQATRINCDFTRLVL